MLDLFFFSAISFLSIFAAFLVKTIPIFIFSKTKPKKNLSIFLSSFFGSNLKKLLHKDNLIIILASLILLFLIYKLSGFDRRAIFIMLFAWTVLILIFIDQKHAILPDMITIPMIWAGMILNTNEYTRTVGIKESISGAVLGYLTLRLFADLYYFIRKKDGLGRGDIKFIAMIGSWLGSIALPLILLIASIIFVIWHTIILNFKNNVAYPFGPFIGLSVIVYLLFNLYLLKNGIFVL